MKKLEYLKPESKEIVLNLKNCLLSGSGGEGSIGGDGDEDKDLD